MTLTEFFSKMELNQKDAEVIFDRDEPVGTPTDVVMPRRHWFRRSSQRDRAGVRPRGLAGTQNVRRDGTPAPSLAQSSSRQP